MSDKRAGARGAVSSAADRGNLGVLLPKQARDKKENEKRPKESFAQSFHNLTGSAEQKACRQANEGDD
jgi:hypothetical protein